MCGWERLWWVCECICIVVFPRDKTVACDIETAISKILCVSCSYVHAAWWIAFIVRRLVVESELEKWAALGAKFEVINDWAGLDKIGWWCAVLIVNYNFYKYMYRVSFTRFLPWRQFNCMNAELMVKTRFQTKRRVRRALDRRLGRRAVWSGGWGPRLGVGVRESGF